MRNDGNQGLLAQYIQMYVSQCGKSCGHSRDKRLVKKA